MKRKPTSNVRSLPRPTLGISRLQRISMLAAILAPCALLACTDTSSTANSSVQISGTTSSGLPDMTPDSGPDSPAPPPACENVAEAAGIDFVSVEGDPSKYGQTDSDKPDTAEVYCVFPTTPTRKPIVMVPGLGLSHYMFLGTPDARAGFVAPFVDAGHPVFVVNPSGNRVAGDVASPPAGVSRWDSSQFWSKWGFGPSDGVPYPDVRFPTGHIAAFIEHMPYWGKGNDPVEELTQVLKTVGPAILLVHSAAGEDGFRVALDQPTLVDTLVVIEPVGCPLQGEAVPTQPFLAIYGDYIKERGQSSRLNACSETVAMVKSSGQRAELIEYPKKQPGIFGNTHLLSQDDNNADIANDVVAWLAAPP